MSTDRREHGRDWSRVTSAFMGATLGGYLWRWLTVSPSEVLRSDFLPTQVAATLIRTGQRANLYADQAQGAVYAGLVGTDHQGDLLYNHAPLAGVLDVPLSALTPVADFRAWSAVQLLCLALATWIAGRAAGRSQIASRTQRLLTWLVPMALIAVLPMLLEGQDVGFLALALAGMYALIAAGRPLGAGCAIGIAVCLGKPHIALGIAAFVVGRGQRRLTLGGALGVLVGAGLSVLTVGSGASIAFLTTAARSNGLFPHQGQYGFAGLFSSIFGEGSPVGTALAGLSIVAALAAAAWLGFTTRACLSGATPPGPDGERRSFGRALGAAVLLSLVAAPHVYSHDLALLVPVVAWLLTDAIRKDARVAWPGPRALTVSFAWVAFTLAVGIDYVLMVDRFRVTPCVVVALAILCARKAPSRQTSV